MTPVPRLDYSKTPSGYGEIRAVGFEDGTFWSIGHESGLGFRGGETADVLAAAWVHYKAHNDPPGMCVFVWPREKAGDPPTAWCVALHGQPHFTAFTEPEADACRPDVETQVRAAAWAWYDRRLAVHAKVADDPRHRIDFCGSCGTENEPQDDDECPACGSTSCLISTWGEQQADRYRTGERYATNDPGIDDVSPTWPRCLTWSEEQVAEVERWLVDSTAEMPEVLRG